MFVPKPIKKWIAVFRGEVAPLFLFLSVLLGFWFGLMPGFYGFHVGLLILALILNVHFGIFLIFAGIGKSLAFAVGPLLYHTGVWIQGHAPILIDLPASIPILGATAYSRFALNGALLIGPLLGAILGLLLARSVTGFRRTWLRLQDDSETFNRWRQKRWIGLLSSLLIGKGAANVQAVLKRRPKVIRLAGVVVAVVVAAAAATAAYSIQGDVLSDYAARSLTSANGAEVNLERLDLDVFGGRLSANGIQATDPANPANNRVAIGELTATVSTWNLLLGRVVLDEVKLVKVETNTQRTAPGKVAAQAEQPVPAGQFDAGKYDLATTDVATLESYCAKAKEIREHLQKVREWLPGDEAESTPLPTAIPKKYLEYLTAQSESTPTPRLLIRRLLLEDVNVPLEQLGLSNIECTNLSDSPRGAGLPVEIEIRSIDQPSSVRIACRWDRSGGGAELEASFEDVDLKEFQKQLKSSNAVTFEGGTATVTVSGTIARDAIDLAIKVKTKDMKATAGGALCGLDPQISSEAMKVLQNLETTFRLVGPTTEPRLVFDSSALGTQMRDALVRAGKEELARRATELLGDQLPGGVPDAASALSSPDAVKDVGSKLLGDKTDGQSAKEGDATDAAEKGRDALGGLLGGKKKDSKDSKDDE